MWGSIFSPLIARVSVLHATDTPGGYVEGFGEKSFSFSVEISQLSFVKPSDVTSRAFMKGTEDLNLVTKDFNYFKILKKNLDLYH